MFHAVLLPPLPRLPEVGFRMAWEKAPALGPAGVAAGNRAIIAATGAFPWRYSGDRGRALAGIAGHGVSARDPLSDAVIAAM